METENKSSRNIGIVFGVVVVVGVISATVFLGKNSSNPPVQDTTVVNTPPVADKPTVSQIPPADTTKKTSVYKDGTYTAIGSYMSPGGEDQLTVKLTLANDIITDVSAISGAGDHTSQRYQDKFLSGYKAYVVGKNIKDVYLTKVSGSSLTPKGFDDAIAQIKSQAKA